MKNQLFVSAVLIGSVLFSGCATRTKMVFEDDAQRLDQQSKPVYLLTATIKNVYRPSYQPKLLVAHVEKPEAKSAADKLNFVVDEKAKDETNSAEKGNNYLLRFELEPGPYEIKGFSSFVYSFPIQGSFFVPLHSNLEAKGNGVFYLGHVNATVRERQGDEFKAGPTIPLLDQAVAGASGGTFDVTITDELAVDEPAFRAKFPALSGVPITKAVLAPFDRAKAQKWWEQN